MKGWTWKCAGNSAVLGARKHVDTDVDKYIINNCEKEGGNAEIKVVMNTVEVVIQRLKSFMYSSPLNLYDSLFDDLSEAIKALEKREPKKPAFVDIRFRNHGRHISDGVSLSRCYKCPGCNTHLFRVWGNERYCKECGQALDWSEEDDRV